MSEHTENAAKAFQDFVIKIADKEECQSLKTEFKRVQRKFKMRKK